MSKNTAGRVLCLAVLAMILGAAPALAESTWHSPLVAFASRGERSALKISRNNANYIYVHATEPVASSDIEKVVIPLTLAAGDITGVKICYRVLARRLRGSYIDSWQMLSNAAARSTTEVARDLTDLVSTTSTCHTSRVSATIAGSVSLRLRVVLADRRDGIFINAIEIQRGPAGPPPATR